MTSSPPSVTFTFIPSSLLKFPPEALPATLPPPPGPPALAHPFSIPPNIYNAMLSIDVPITIALVYATTVTFLNRLNRKRNHKPWPISKSKIFFAFVIFHNVLLAIYSAGTFVGMINTIRISIPGWNDEYGLVGAIDSLCKINGPRGLGSAATYSSSTSTWGIANTAMHLAADGLPDSTDVGRIWNEGLAFYGWFFYLSKFYEVMDTFIILAKGRRSNLLQTYHHAGAMICMWAGIRYMAPPIWMFVLVNSGLHALMYTYYLLTALSIKVPMVIKRTLTTMQITQFVVGVSFAFAHLFIAYSIPISVPYTVTLYEAVSAVASDATSAVSEIATAAATADAGSWFKKVLFRAAGREGLAENMVNKQGETFGMDAIHIAKELRSREEIRYREEFKMIHCTDTSGQTFAILLNCMYLAPLTWLFVRFFIISYTRRVEAHRRSSTGSTIEKSVNDAVKGVTREINDAVGTMGDDEMTAESKEPVKSETLTKADKLVESETPAKAEKTVESETPAKAKMTVESETPAKAEKPVESEAPLKSKSLDATT